MCLNTPLPSSKEFRISLRGDEDFLGGGLRMLRYSGVSRRECENKEVSEYKQENR